MTQSQGAFIQPLPELGDKLRAMLPQPTADAVLEIAELYVATRQSEAEDGEALAPSDARAWIGATMTMISRLEDRLRNMPDEVSDPMHCSLALRHFSSFDMVTNAQSALHNLDNALLEADRAIEAQPTQTGRPLSPRTFMICEVAKALERDSVEVNARPTGLLCQSVALVLKASGENVARMPNVVGTALRERL